MADTVFENHFISDRDEYFDARIWEMLLARHLTDQGHKLSSADEGPDLGFHHKDQKIWVEAVVPSPDGLPQHWVTPPKRGEMRAHSVPNEKILLRITSALKEKNEKLIGRTLKVRQSGEEIRKPGYLENKLVNGDDAYVVAINSCRLGFGPLAPHRGVSQFPLIVESAVPVGPIEVVFDRKNLDVVEQRYSHRTVIKKPNGAAVPTDNFLNPDYAGISAVLGSRMDIDGVTNRASPVAVIHNPLARNPIPAGILGADEEYVVDDHGDYYTLRPVNDEEAIQ